VVAPDAKGNEGSPGSLIAKARNTVM
jgi:hypothetical protein